MKEWLEGIAYEVAFWNSLFANKSQREGLFAWSSYGSDISLHNFDAITFLTEWESLHGKPAEVLDVGCGLSYCTGNHAGEGKAINIHYIDPLAAFYNRILSRHKQDLPQIEFGMLEYLSSTYNGKAALIIIQNALDHSSNPVKGILESMECLDIGGVLYLKHYPNEAEKENYRGFHKHNVDEENGKLVLWNRSGRTNINDLVEPFADITVSRYDQPDEVIAVIRKKAPLPQGLLDRKNDVSVLCHNMLEIAETFDSPSFAVRYHTKRIGYGAMQFTARFFSRQTKEKIKKLLRKRNSEKQN